MKADNLKRLALWNVEIAASEYVLLLAGLTKLTHLDLSNASEIGNLYFHSLVPNLVSLSLYNVKINADPQTFINNVCHLKHLRYLIDDESLLSLRK